MAIVGPPNAGKSSLLNVLTAQDAAIVSPVPGTTRDTVTVAIDLEGYRVLSCSPMMSKWTLLGTLSTSFSTSLRMYISG